MFSSKKRECPYCRKDGGYLELRKGYKYLKNIHKEKKIKEKKIILKECKNTEKIELTSNCCMAILASGKNKGKKCTNKCKFGSYCGRHKNYYVMK